MGSDCRDPNAYRHAIRNTKKLFEYAEKIGYIFKLLDLGGGFPGTDHAIKFVHVSLKKTLKRKLHLIFMDSVKLVFEHLALVSN